ncbi:lipid-A-disaccharide synthase [Oscillatoriales cyanobacterium USR001]|nr:lipid-A-disaccharide synthase [Oscillatoriales cyanobacterium USR001]
MTIDILILSNGPGELVTWVRPVVQTLREKLGYDRAFVRISVILSPCPNASGSEAAIARSYPEIDRVQAAEHFFPFLLSGKTVENWDWRTKGIVLFLGGDQFFTAIIGKRLKYRTIVYAEWEARWLNWIDRFGVMKADMITKIPQKYAHKFTVVGDLMADLGKESPAIQNYEPNTELIGILPGSKAAKLASGVPLSLAIAEQIHRLRPQTRFAIVVAPTLDLETLARFADPKYNQVLPLFGSVSAELYLEEPPFLLTKNGVKLELYTQSPAYSLLKKCCLCLTTIGANTAELGSLGVPMIVLVPMQQMDAIRTWNGIPGLLVNLPLFGSGFATVINWLAWKMRQGKLFAWPNIWAQEEIVPELIGKLEPQALAELAIDYLSHPEKLAEMRDRLRAVRGESGAATKLTQIVCEEISLL